MGLAGHPMKSRLNLGPTLVVAWGSTQPAGCMSSFISDNPYDPDHVGLGLATAPDAQVFRFGDTKRVPT